MMAAGLLVVLSGPSGVGKGDRLSAASPIKAFPSALSVADYPAAPPRGKDGPGI